MLIYHVSIYSYLFFVCCLRSYILHRHCSQHHFQPPAAPASQLTNPKMDPGKPPWKTCDFMVIYGDLLALFHGYKPLDTIDTTMKNTYLNR